MKRFIQFLLVISSLTVYTQNQHELLDEYMSNYQYINALTYIEKQNIDKDLLFKKALCYKGLSDYKRAIAILEPLSGDFFDDRKIKLELANCYVTLSEWDKGIECYDILIEQDSTNVYYKMQKADILFRKNDYEKALNSYKLLNRNYGLNNMISRTGQCYEQMNMPDSAIVYYKDAWAVDSTDVFSVSRLINIILKQNNKMSGDNNIKNQISDAVGYSEIYIARDSTNKQINLLNALGYYTLDLYEEAIPRFEKCYTAGDSTLILNRSLGISYYYLGLSGRAYPFLKKAYEQDTTNVNVMYCLGTACNDLGNGGEAVKYFTRILEKVVPADATLYAYYRGLAIAYEKEEEMVLASENYIMAEKYASPIQKIALLYNIASLYDYDLDKPDKALDYYYKYRISMEDYLQILMDKNADKTEINEMKFKLKNLNTHISRLEKQLK